MQVTSRTLIPILTFLESLETLPPMHQELGFQDLGHQELEFQDLRHQELGSWGVGIWGVRSWGVGVGVSGFEESGVGVWVLLIYYIYLIITSKCVALRS